MATWASLRSVKVSHKFPEAHVARERIWRRGSSPRALRERLGDTLTPSFRVWSSAASASPCLERVVLRESLVKLQRGGGNEAAQGRRTRPACDRREPDSHRSPVCWRLVREALA